MSDEEEERKKALLWDAPPPPRQPRPGEPLFEFVRASDRKRIVVELRFNGESYGWEAQLLEDGIDLFSSHGLFPTRARWRCSGPKTERDHWSGHGCMR